MAKEYGDFQTNINLARRISKLILSKNIDPELVIEPTCGEGSFIIASIEQFQNAEKIYGIEIQEEYVNKAKENLSKLNDINTQVEIIKDDIFTHNFEEVLKEKDKEILIIGNPPWVTNAELKGKNLPKKYNIKGTNGLDAITGKANFDISEYIILYLLKIFSGYNGHLAFLCKTQVARNIVQFLPSTKIQSSDFNMYVFDAKKEFGVTVDACLFICKLYGKDRSYQCKVYELEDPKKIISAFGWVGNKFVSNIEKYGQTSQFDAKSQLVWRSGIKHDCSSIMELEKVSSGTYRNGLNEIVNIEDALVYPLVKSSYIKKPLISSSNTKIIVTQTKPGEDTGYIKLEYPKLWSYLEAHKEFFERRKSIIYKKAPLYSIFGIGEYSFRDYKIAISGLYKKSTFSMLYPENDKPIMVDDSCYTIPMKNRKHALIMLAILNSTKVQKFLESIAFLDAKRPYTKDILMRIDLVKALESVELTEINQYLKKENMENEKITAEDIKEIKNSLLKA